MFVETVLFCGWIAWLHSCVFNVRMEQLWCPDLHTSDSETLRLGWLPGCPKKGHWFCSAHHDWRKNKSLHIVKLGTLLLHINTWSICKETANTFGLMRAHWHSRIRTHTHTHRYTNTDKHVHACAQKRTFSRDWTRLTIETLEKVWRVRGLESLLNKSHQQCEPWVDFHRGKSQSVSGLRMLLKQIRFVPAELSVHLALRPCKAQMAAADLWLEPGEDPQRAA